MLDPAVGRRIPGRRPLVGLLEDRLGLPARVVAAGRLLLGEQLGAIGDAVELWEPFEGLAYHRRW